MGTLFDTVTVRLSLIEYELRDRLLRPVLGILTTDVDICSYLVVLNRPLIVFDNRYIMTRLGSNRHITRKGCEVNHHNPNLAEAS